MAISIATETYGETTREVRMDSQLVQLSYSFCYEDGRVGSPNRPGLGFPLLSSAFAKEPLVNDCVKALVKWRDMTV